MWRASHIADQITRARSLPPDQITEISRALAAAEHTTRARRRQSLTTLATRLDHEARIADDPAKLQVLIGSVRDLAAAAH